MVTMKDIANLAGVSQGSVSNVLNNRGNVSSSIIEKVMDAANQLGYQLNTQAQQLRRSSALSNLIAIILPDIVQKRYSILYSSLVKDLRDSGFSIRLFITENSSYLEEKAINDIVSLRAQAVVSVSNFSHVGDVYKPLYDLGSLIIFAGRMPDDAERYIGFDLDQIGQIIGEDLTGRGCHRIGVLMDEDPACFYQGFILQLGKRFSNNTEVHIQQSDYYNSLNKAFSLLNDIEAPDAIICTSGDLTKAMKACLDIMGIDVTPYIFSITCETNDIPGPNESILNLNYSSLGARISWEIRDSLHIAREDEKAPSLPKIRLQQASKIAVYKERQINVLIPDNRSTRALKYLAPLFTKKTGIVPNFTVLPLAELTSSQVQMPYSGFFDVLRTNVTSLPSLPDDALLEIDQPLFDEISKTMLNTPRDLFPYGRNSCPVGLPFDMSMYFLVYRKDLFSDTLMQRRFYEQTGRVLDVPTKYEEENFILSFFTRSINRSSPIEFGTTGIINEITTIAYEFFHRYMHTGARFFTDKGEPAFDHDAAVNVLQNYLDMMKYSDIVSDFNRKDPGVYNFCGGKTALEHVSTSFSSPLSESMIRGKLGFANLPRTLSRIGGGALSIPIGSKHKEEAMEFIEWACSEDMAIPLAKLGGHPVHKSMFRNYDIIQQFPWLALVEEEADKHYEKSDLDRLNRFQFEQLVGGSLRSLFGGLISVEDASSLIENNIMACRLK